MGPSTLPPAARQDCTRQKPTKIQGTPARFVSYPRPNINHKLLAPFLKVGRVSLFVRWAHWHLVRYFSLGNLSTLRIGFSAQSPMGPRCAAVFSCRPSKQRLGRTADSNRQSGSCLDLSVRSPSCCLEAAMIGLSPAIPAWHHSCSSDSYRRCNAPQPAPHWVIA